MVRPEDFYSDEPPGRVMGVENENDVQLLHDYPDPDIPFEERLEYTMRGLIRRSAENTGRYRCVLIDEPNRTIDLWLDNGARVYPDLGLFEYCTQEAVGPQEAAAAESAGILAVEHLVEASGVPHRGVFRRTGSILPASGYRDPLRQKIVTTGRHPNLLVPTSLFQQAEPHLSGLLATGLATGAWAWNGTLGPEGYEWSQKWRGIGQVSTWKLDDRHTEGRKPMVMYRNSTNHDHDVNSDRRWSRIEVRFADAPFARIAIYLGLASLTLTTRLAEHLPLIEDQLPKLQLKDPKTALRRLATSQWLDGAFEMQDRRKLTADNIQELYGETFQLLIDRGVQLPTDESAAIPRLIDAAQLQAKVRTKQELGPMAEVSETARKYQYLLERVPGNLINSNRQAMALDLYYERIDHYRTKNGVVRTGTGRKLAASKDYAAIDEAVVSEAQVLHLANHPSERTRSISRARSVRAQSIDKSVGYMDWSGYGNTGDRSHTYWTQPYAS